MTIIVIICIIILVVIIIITVDMATEDQLIIKFRALELIIIAVVVIV